MPDVERAIQIKQLEDFIGRNPDLSLVADLQKTDTPITLVHKNNHVFVSVSGNAENKLFNINPDTYEELYIRFPAHTGYPPATPQWKRKNEINELYTILFLQPLRRLIRRDIENSLGTKFDSDLQLPRYLHKGNVNLVEHQFERFVHGETLLKMAAKFAVLGNLIAHSDLKPIYDQVMNLVAQQVAQNPEVLGLYYLQFSSLTTGEKRSTTEVSQEISLFLFALRGNFVVRGKSNAAGRTFENNKSTWLYMQRIEKKTKATKEDALSSALVAYWAKVAALLNQTNAGLFLGD